MTLYRPCIVCHGGSCQHTEACRGCRNSDYLGFVSVEPTDRICTTHKSYASEWIEGKEQCAERGFLDKFGMTNPCNVVDMVRVEDV